jgi:hypothetical protein
MAGINTFRNADKVSMPTNLFHVMSALRLYRVLLRMLLKSTEPLTMEFDRLCLAWNQEEAEMDKLRETTPYFVALVLRWLQLRLAIGVLNSLASAMPTWSRHRTSWNSFRRSIFRSSCTQVFQLST